MRPHLDKLRLDRRSLSRYIKVVSQRSAALARTRISAFNLKVSQGTGQIPRAAAIWKDYLFRMTCVISTSFAVQFRASPNVPSYQNRQYRVRVRHTAVC